MTASCSERCTAVAAGLKACVWPGRFETVQRLPRQIILDGAHNPAAWQALLRTLKKTCTQRRLILIIGIMRDKDMHSLQRLVAQAHTCILFKPCIDRAAGREVLEKYIVFSRKKRVFWCETIARALELAYAKSVPQDCICVTGSLFAVGEAREQLIRTTRAASGRIGL